MQKTLIHCVVWTIAFVCFRTATATEKVDISKVITKADAEAVLGVPVEDAKGPQQRKPRRIL